MGKREATPTPVWVYHWNNNPYGPHGMSGRHQQISINLPHLLFSVSIYLSVNNLRISEYSCLCARIHVYLVAEGQRCYLAERMTTLNTVSLLFQARPNESMYQCTGVSCSLNKSNTLSRMEHRLNRNKLLCEAARKATGNCETECEEAEKHGAVRKFVKPPGRNTTPCAERAWRGIGRPLAQLRTLLRR